MKILYFAAGVLIYIFAEVFQVPGIKQKIRNQVYDYGIFAMQPLTGKTAVFLGRFSICFLRIGIVIYIILGVYIFW